MELKDITPTDYQMCASGGCCPAVFATDNDSYVIIGKVLPASVIEQLKDRVAGDEWVIEVPKGMIDKIK